MAEWDLKLVAKLYNWSLNYLLGVRINSCNDICYIESGYNSLTSIVKLKQRKYFVKFTNERYGLQDDPLGFALRLVLNNTYKTSNYLNNLINSNLDDYLQDSESLKTSIRQSDSSRRRVYCNSINGDLSTHSIYSTKHNIYEPYRIAFTRFRISSHNLAVETGR